MTFITERNGDGTILVSPRNEADQSALVVICHGLGDSAEGFVDVAEVSLVTVTSSPFSNRAESSV
jgi:predicted esterase